MLRAPNLGCGQSVPPHLDFFTQFELVAAVFADVRLEPLVTGLSAATSSQPNIFGLALRALHIHVNLHF